MRVLVCGGRKWSNQWATYDFLDWLHRGLGITLVINGKARGADTLGRQWAIDRGIEKLDFPADWDRYKKAAGPIRNQLMLKEGKPELIIAFPGETGTANMVSLALKAQVPVIRFPGDDYEPR